MMQGVPGYFLVGGALAAAQVGLAVLPVIFADPDPPDPYGPPTTLFGIVAAAFTVLMGLMVWLIRQNQSVTIPALTETFNKGLEKTLEKSTTEQKEMRLLFEAEQKAARELFERRQDAVLEFFRGEYNKAREQADGRYTGALAKIEQLHREQMSLIREQQTDLHDQSQSLRSLLQSMQIRTKLADAVQSAEDAIWLKTADGLVVAWNRSAERLLGWRESDVVGQSVYKIVPPDLHEEERSLLQRVQRRERVESYQTDRLHREGHRVRVQITLSPVVGTDGKVVNISAIARTAGL
jgi:PAS domain S-box-containing protein